MDPKDSRPDKNESIKHVPTQSMLTTLQLLAKQLYISGVNAAGAPGIEPEIHNEFTREFWSADPEALEYAFRTFRGKCSFVPTIAEIRALVGEWEFNQREARKEQARQAEKAATEEGRKQGKVPELREVLAQLGELAGKMKIPEHERKLQESRAQTPSRFSIPTIAPRMTAEQIAARREKERAEIERYKQQAKAEE